MKVSIIIPTHNEEILIRNILDDTVGCVPSEVIEEVIVVNDHSIDRTVKVVEECAQKYSIVNIKVISNDTSAGFANALRQGIKEARGDLIIYLMADGCDRVSDIDVMFNKLAQGDFDMVCASRYMKNGKRNGGSLLKGFFSRFVGVSLNCIIKIPTKDSSNAFKMYKREILDKIALTSSGFEISMELCLRAYLAGYRIGEVPTVWYEREQGSSDFKMFKQSFGYIRLYVWGILNYFKNNLCPICFMRYMQ